MASKFKYIIVGGGLAGASAVEGIRSRDTSGSIALFGKENRIPYDRPPLSKGLWLGKTNLDQLPVYDESFYKTNNVHLYLNTEITTVEPKNGRVIDGNGNRYEYDKLLIATGGEPRRLSFGEGVVHYYRTVDDYLSLREAADHMEEFLLIGGGFIGGELAAALTLNKKKVTMIFPERFILQKVLPGDLAAYVTEYYRAKGVNVLSGDVLTDIQRAGGKTLATMKSGKKITADMTLAAIGLNLHVEMAKQAGLKIENGIAVNTYLQTSDPDIYAAGDVAFFPSPSLGKSIRVEHWNNAQSQGKHVGENMAGANKPFTYLPYFYSDLFDLGFEAVGELDSRMKTFADWRESAGGGREGVVYYLDDGNRVKGVLLWNVWEKVDAARVLIDRKAVIKRPEDLKGKL
jgi:NADPH-dependent 2,4-dienoyl-CoA reductase/sulfur reductase-like enzyme